MKKSMNLSFILIIFLILQHSFQKEEFCKIELDDLIVPQEGCTLKQSEETVVKNIKLNGELKINRRNHLKYENIKAESAQAGVVITSNYEKIVIEDTSSIMCDKTNLQNINLNFASSAINEQFNIEYVKLNTYKLVNRQSNLLYRGAQVIIFNEYERKITKVQAIDGENIILQDELLVKKSDLYFQNYGLESKVYHQLLLFDDKRIIFKNNCLRISSNLNPSHGAIFLNQRYLKYESNLDNFNFSEVIVYDDDIITNSIQSNFEIQANLKNIILMSKNKSFKFITQKPIVRLFIIHSQMFKLIFNNPKDQSLTQEITVFHAYGSQGIILFSKQIEAESVIIANSEINFEGEKQQQPILWFDEGVLSKSNTDKWIVDKILFLNFFIRSEISLSNYCDLNIQQSIFDGADLDTAIRLSLKSIQLKIQDVQFINFEKAKYPLIYTMINKDQQIDKGTFGTPYTDQFPNIISLSTTTFAFDITKSKFTNLQNVQLFTDYFIGEQKLATLQNEELYKNKNIIQLKDPFFSDRQLTLLSAELPSKVIQFGMKDGDKFYEIFVEIQDGKTTLKFDEQIQIDNAYEYKITFKLKQNQVGPISQELVITTLNFENKQVFVRGYKKVRIFFDSQQPLLRITEFEDLEFNEQDSSIGTNIVNSGKNSKTIKLDFCKQGEVIQNNKCQQSCSDNNIKPYLGICFDQNQYQQGYYQGFYQTKDSDNKIKFNSCSWYCNNCDDENSCNDCRTNNQESNCKDLNQAQFFSYGNKIEQCVQNCKNCNSEEKCNICNENMGVLDGQKCKPLDTLGVGEYFKYQKIYRCPDQCKKCYSSNYCQECKEGYDLIHGKCKKQCEIGFTSNRGRCEQCYPGVKKCDDYKNMICSPGYVLEKNNCVKSNISEPRICDGVSCYACSNQTDKSCQNPYSFICEIGYYYSLEQKQCFQCNKMCQECENNANQCTSCSKNYILENGVCSQCPEQHIKINNTCQKCSDGYFSKDDNKCYQCDSKCKQCINSSDNCVSCNQQYYYENKQCLPCKENCKECKDSSVCLSCISDDYQVQNGGCSQVAESDSGLNEGEIIGIVLGSIFGVLTILLICNLVRIKHFKNSKKQISPSTEKGSSLKAKDGQGHLEIKIGTQSKENNNIQTLLNLETQQILQYTETKNEVLQTITSV